MDFLLTAAFAALVGMGVGSGGLYLIFLTLNRGITLRQAQLKLILLFSFVNRPLLIYYAERKRFTQQSFPFSSGSAATPIPILTKSGFIRFS